MAPEIHMRMAYKGEEVDLFATAIILFIMYAGTPPFSKADPRDPYYNLIYKNNFEKFWAAHARFKPDKNYYSVEFRDMLSKMFSFEPKNRLTIEKIKNHPWLEGNIKTKDELKKEFDKRRKIVEDELEKERLKKQIEKEKKGMANAVYTGNAFRGIDDLQDKEIKLANFYTSADADYLLKFLLLCIQEEKIDNKQIKISEKNYRIDFAIPDDEETMNITAKIFKQDDEINFGSTIKFTTKRCKLLENLKKLKIKEELIKKD